MKSVLMAKTCVFYFVKVANTRLVGCEFGGSTTGERGHEECQHDVLLAAKIGKFHGLVVVVGQSEVGRHRRRLSLSAEDSDLEPPVAARATPTRPGPWQRTAEQIFSSRLPLDSKLSQTSLPPRLLQSSNRFRRIPPWRAMPYEASRACASQGPAQERGLRATKMNIGCLPSHRVQQAIRIMNGRQRR